MKMLNSDSANLQVLQSLHGHLSSFCFVTFFRKISDISKFLISGGSKFQIFSPI